MDSSSFFHITCQDGLFCEARPGESLLAALTRSGFILSAPCGGRGICGKCKVKLLEGRFNGPLPEKNGLFSACQAIPLSDMTIELPAGSGMDAADFGMDAAGRTIRPNRKVNRAGVGIDIGTTTVSAELIDLDTGETLETVSALNAQRSFGADVMSRIDAARKGKTGELFSAINKQVETILERFTPWGPIEHCVVSGNTTMLHLFTNTDPSGMGAAPFTPVFLEEQHLTGLDLSLPVKQVTLLPGISAFVGADITAGLAALDIFNREDASLLVDIGTNGEMALLRKKTGNKNRLFCCSTAAGPCFEGAEISCGMGAQPGAINRIMLKDGKVTYTTLGTLPPRGICGAALIDALALMKQMAVIDETGALADEYEETGFPLAEGISISGRDVRQFQLAKSAILSGIKILCGKAEAAAADCSVYIAGGLGFFIDTKNAVTAGLLPPEFTGRSSACGNLSLKGAVQCLREAAFLPRCREITAHSEVADLGSDPDFAEAFAENMYF
ncbi:hypothetical protein AGMMS50230_08460 [Spirochaetia bacterium]|nr:hypothetical protein AGMMS50230_08460 [Spirochaetia bacterium]